MIGHHLKKLNFIITAINTYGISLAKSKNVLSFSLIEVKETFAIHEYSRLKAIIKVFIHYLLKHPTAYCYTFYFFVYSQPNATAIQFLFDHTEWQLVIHINSLQLFTTI